MITPFLQNFSSTEFRNGHGNWWQVMSARLVVMLDVLRFQLDTPIWISNNDYALGRRLGPIRLSEHNINKWQEVLAADVFVEGVYTQDEARKVVDKAISIGFTGIGVYADTMNNDGEAQVMFHLGVRPTQRMGDPATWGRVNSSYDYSLEQAIQALPLRRNA